MYLLKSTLNWMGGNTATAQPNASSQEEAKPPEQKPEAGSTGGHLWEIIGSNLGGDVLRIGVSLPSWMYEPLSSLQRQAEMFEYADLLSKAAKCSDPLERMALIGTFAISSYSATKRTRPTFNPILGETFEFIDARTNAKFFSEQVSHHPPISATHVEGDGFSVIQNSCPTTKFLGNAIDIITHGNSHIFFPGVNEHIHYQNPTTRCNNIIIGSRWMEHYGFLNFRNITNGSTCVIEFKKAGMFQGPQYQVSGYVADQSGAKCIKIEGRWDEFVTLEWLVDTASGKKGEKRESWRIHDNNFIEGHPYGYSKFAQNLNFLDDELDALLPQTDSRRRLDRLYLEKGEYDTATKWKRTMEERQRADRKIRKDTWTPVWFNEGVIDDCAAIAGPSDHGFSADSNGRMKFWKYLGNYWEEREQRVKALTCQGIDFVQPYPLPKHVLGLACDFAAYQPKSTPTTETTLTDTDSDNDKNGEVVTDAATQN